MMSATKRILGTVLACGLLCYSPISMSAGSDHPHHVAAAYGVARHNSQESAFLGFDYVYRFDNGWTGEFFLEQVRGDFDISAYGVGIGKILDNGWKFSTGPGVETKLKSGKTKFLWHVSTGYDWHIGNWSIGPMASYDYIEDVSNTVYLGIGIGYGF